MALYEALRNGLPGSRCEDTDMVKAMYNPVFDGCSSSSGLSVATQKVDKEAGGQNGGNVWGVSDGLMGISSEETQQTHAPLSYAKAVQRPQQDFFSVFANQNKPGAWKQKKN